MKLYKNDSRRYQIILGDQIKLGGGGGGVVGANSTSSYHNTNFSSGNATSVSTDLSSR